MTICFMDAPLILVNNSNKTVHLNIRSLTSMNNMQLTVTFKSAPRTQIFEKVNIGFFFAF